MKSFISWERSAPRNEIIIGGFNDDDQRLKIIISNIQPVSESRSLELEAAPHLGRVRMSYLIALMERGRRVPRTRYEKIRFGDYLRW